MKGSGGLVHARSSGEFGVRPAKWSAVALATLVFFLLGIVTGWFHDLLFMSHSSIQDGVEVCDWHDCWTEDGVLAYTSRGWALAGNTFAFAMLAVRGFAAFIAYVAFDERDDYNILLLLLIPAVMAGLAAIDLPYELYRALRVAVFICCGFLAIGAWRIGMRLIPAPLALLAILFNPLIEFHFSRSVWIAVDAVTAVFLCALAVGNYTLNRASGMHEFKRQDATNE